MSTDHPIFSLEEIFAGFAGSIEIARKQARINEIWRQVAGLATKLWTKSPHYGTKLPSGNMIVFAKTENSDLTGYVFELSWERPGNPVGTVSLWNLHPDGSPKSMVSDKKSHDLATLDYHFVPIVYSHLQKIIGTLAYALREVGLEAEIRFFISQAPPH